MRRLGDRLEFFGRRDARILLSLLIVVPLGFTTKLYAGPSAEWVRTSFGGVLYEVFWCLMLQLLLPRVRPMAIAVGVLLGTCALEFLQLWRPPFLQALRSSLLGRTLLGDTFDWWDFAHYVAGSALGWWWLKRLAPRPAVAES